MINFLNQIMQGLQRQRGEYHDIRPQMDPNQYTAQMVQPDPNASFFMNLYDPDKRMALMDNARSYQGPIPGSY